MKKALEQAAFLQVRDYEELAVLDQAVVNFKNESRTGAVYFGDALEVEYQVRSRWVVEQRLRTHSPVAGTSARLGAVAFVHRFGSTLNPHLHFHCVVLDGVFESQSAERVVFREATGIDEQTAAAVQERVRRRLARVPSCGAAC